jgi:RNA polymerase sigma factor (sigma-70 family)
VYPSQVADQCAGRNLEIHGIRRFAVGRVKGCGTGGVAVQSAQQDRERDARSTIAGTVAHDDTTAHQRDGALLARCRSGEARAWRLLLERYERLVYSIPLSFGLSRDDAAEVAQATFTELIRSLDRIEFEDRLTAWLGTVAKRQTIRVFERHRRDAALEAAAGHAVATAMDPAIVEERVADVEWVVQALALVPERCQRLLKALYFDDAEPSYAEVAAALGIPLGSIGPSRARCLAAMRSALAALDGSPVSIS